MLFRNLAEKIMNTRRIKRNLGFISYLLLVAVCQVVDTYLRYKNISDENPMILVFVMAIFGAVFIQKHNNVSRRLLLDSLVLLGLTIAGSAIGYFYWIIVIIDSGVSTISTDYVGLLVTQVFAIIYAVVGLVTYNLASLVRRNLKTTWGI